MSAIQTFLLKYRRARMPVPQEFNGYNQIDLPCPIPNAQSPMPNPQISIPLISHSWKLRN
ncbi:MAG: hypothetical protein AAF630_07795 [Cyanobacteria bacterium P01_C01_bin.38]